MLTDTALKNVQACIASCDELIGGKFIFAENIIAKILDDISNSEEIYGLIKECMKNFNFNTEFSRAKVKLPTKDGYFIMPESKAVLLPLVFCILVDIRDKKINFREFLKNYFTSEDINEFENFANTIIVPFKEALMHCFEIEETKSDNNESEHAEQPKEQEENTEIEEVKEATLQETEENVDELAKVIENKEKTEKFFFDIELVLKQMLSEIECEKHIKELLKEDLKFMINNIFDCIKSQDIRNTSAYIVAINYMAKPVKSLKFLSQELREKLTEFYL